MRKVINISIPEPCHENWNKMTKEEKDRHCSVCSKSVIDFTNSTDEQLITSLENNGNLCGRFKSTQLNRDIVLIRKHKNTYASLAASGLFAFLSLNSLETKAQGAPKVVQTDSTGHNLLLGKIVPSVLNERIISGTVTLSTDGLPLPGAKVQIMGSSVETYSDFDGNFKIKTKNNDSLQISYIGLKTETILLGNVNTISISLNEDEDVCLDTIVAGVVDYSYRSDCEKKRIKKQRKLKRKKIREGKIERSATGKFLYNITNIFRTKK